MICVMFKLIDFIDMTIFCYGILDNYYRPQTLSVSHSVHRGGVCPSACWDRPSSPGRHPPGQTPPCRHTPMQTPPGQTPPRADTPSPADGYCCGRYASYWNAFLFTIKSHMVYSKNQHTCTGYRFIPIVICIGRH